MKKQTQQTEFDLDFDTHDKSTATELWLLAGLFLFVVAGLIQLSRHQQASHSEVAKQIDPTGLQNHADFTRNKTPALGL